MKATIVPAQITTVEDRVAGNLSLTQILLLALPLFINSLLYVALPPFSRPSLYKITAFILISLCTASLALRIKNKLVINWLSVLVKYGIRPRYYLSTLNEFGNNPETDTPIDDVPEQIYATVESYPQNILSSADEVYISSLINSEPSKFSFINRKGSLNVQIIENIQKG